MKKIVFGQVLTVVCLILTAAIAGSGCIAAATTVAVMHIVNKDRDIAKVMIDAPAEKVYEAAIRVLEKKPGLEFTEKDRGDYELEADLGKRTISLEADPKGKERCELVVAVRIPEEEQKEGQTPALDLVEEICDELGIKYEVKETKKAGKF